jgi:hypothetical protein
VIGNLAIQTESAEPPVRQIEVNLFAESALGPNAHAIADDQHPHYQCRVDRGSPRPTVEGLQSLTKAIEVEMPIDAPQQVIGRDVVIEAKVVKQPSLRRLNAHHRYLSRIRWRQRFTTLPSHQSIADFFNDIRAKQTAGQLEMFDR